MPWRTRELDAGKVDGLYQLIKWDSIHCRYRLERKVSDLAAMASAFASGLASSIGPCIAPRYLILAAYAAEQKERTRAVVFVTGCLAGYLVYAFAGALIAMFRVGTHIIYALLALALMVCGGRALTAMQHHACEVKRVPSISFGPIFFAVSFHR